MTQAGGTEFTGGASTAAKTADFTLPVVDERIALRRNFLVLWLVGSLAFAAVILLMSRAGVPGWDSAAHLYKAGLVRDGQSVFWDNYWYGGSYGAIGYGFVYYLLVQLVPPAVVAVVATGLVAPLFYVYQRRMWGIADVWPSWMLVLIMCFYLSHGQDPFVLSLALSLGGLALLASGRPLLGAIPMAIGIFANPMGFVVTGVLMLADVVARPALRGRYLWFCLPLVPVIGARMVLGWAFAEPGSYLNETSQVLVYLGFALAGVALAGVNAVHPRVPFVTLFLIYAGVCVATFAMPESPLGNNIGRFFMVFGLPLLFLLRHSRLRRPFPYADLAVIPIVLFGLLQVSLPIDHFTNESDWAQTEQSYFAPALAIAAQRHDVNHRLHVVALRRHWEALMFPRAGFPITRGWYRQADAIHNSLFYAPYDATVYAAWLREMGVEYVFLADSPLDAWSEREAVLLDSSGEFSVVQRAGAWTVYRVSKPEGLAVGLDGGEARVTAFDHHSFSVRVDRPGTYLVKVTWNPYWRVVDGDVTLSVGRNRFLQLEAPAAGVYSASVDVGVRSVVREALREVDAWEVGRALFGERWGTATTRRTLVPLGSPSA